MHGAGGSEHLMTPWRTPYLAAGALIVIAVAANVAARNPLWTWYSIVGGVFLGAWMFLAHRLDWRPSDRILWWALLPFSMHYLGGSLSGLHAFGDNGAYYVFPWWDNLVHFLGGAVVAVVAAAWLTRRTDLARGARVFMAVGAASLLGVCVELYEFSGFLWFGTIDQGFYTNTVLDLYYNALGAGAAGWASTRR